MSDDAIQEDVSNEPQDIGTAKLAAVERLQQVDELAANRERLREEENRGEVTEDLAETSDEEPTEEPTEEPLEAVHEETEKPKRVLKVDGEQIEVDEDKILEAGIRALQKQSTADKRLEEATELLRQAKELKPSVEDVSPLKQESPSLDATELTNNLMYGDEEKVKKAVEGILTAQPQKTFSVEEKQQLTAEIRQQIQQEQVINDAVEYFSREFPEIASDPDLEDLAGIKARRLIDQGDTRNFKEILTDVGKELRQKVGTSDEFSERAEKKKQSETVKSASRRTPPPQQKQESRADIINNIRAARHQTERI